MLNNRTIRNTNLVLPTRFPPIFKIPVKPIKIGLILTSYDSLKSLTSIWWISGTSSSVISRNKIQKIVFGKLWRYTWSWKDDVVLVDRIRIHGMTSRVWRHHWEIQRSKVWHSPIFENVGRGHFWKQNPEAKKSFWELHSASFVEKNLIMIFKTFVGFFQNLPKRVKARYF